MTNSLFWESENIRRRKKPSLSLLGSKELNVMYTQRSVHKTICTLDS